MTNIYRINVFIFQKKKRWGPTSMEFTCSKVWEYGLEKLGRWNRDIKEKQRRKTKIRNTDYVHVYLPYAYISHFKRGVKKKAKDCFNTK